MRRYLVELCACETTGAKVIKLSDTKYAIMDLDTWCDELSHCVHAKFSSVSINIRPCEGSASGFKVVCTLQPVKSWMCMEINSFTVFVWLFVFYASASTSLYHYCVHRDVVST